MVGLAGLIALFGYSILYYGLDQIQGGNNGFFALLNPFKPFTIQQMDDASFGMASGPAVVNPATGINQYGGTASATNPEGPNVPGSPQAKAAGQP